MCNTAIYALCYTKTPATLWRLLNDTSVDAGTKQFIVMENKDIVLPLVRKNVAGEEKALLQLALSYSPDGFLPDAVQQVPELSALAQSAAAKAPPVITPFATGNAGYAIYRDGAFFAQSGQWHAGILVTANSQGSNSVIHAPGSGNGGKVICYTDWSGFFNGNTYKRTTKANASMSSGLRNAVIGTAQTLTIYNIGYTVLSQIDYPVNCYGSYIQPSDITAARCDGVVEYCYEKNSFSVYGSDISYGSAANLLDHAGTRITPQKQAEDYMTLVTTARP